ncbi:winged helix-turn-helix domain-containing tetratricopeptide repeat protein [Mesorhizobium amorphae]|uniref:winged helix-turn-helix domain-containing tetratricopeptide repeat protein n=1 Tax=Mesorhizobium amorphae TaxID=71433 RepID=UPI003ECD38A3
MSGKRYTFGPFLLNPVAGTLLRNGEPIAIGGRGVRLLEALLKCPGEVITKADLMDAGWPGTAVEESNLSVQIASIRKLLGPSADGCEWIVTIPRIGYRFVGSVPESPRPPATQHARHKPTLAVLPFVGIGNDPDQDIFADGLAEDIITALSKLSGLLVIARNSSFVYKDRTVDVRQVAHELAVRYVLEGGVRKSGNRIRITVQLNDADIGGHIWAERYDRELADIFAVQDDVTRQIVSALDVVLGPAETTLLSGSGTKNLEALVCFRQGLGMARASMGPEVYDRSNALMRRAIEIDPAYPEPYASLGMHRVIAYVNAWTDDPDGTLAEAEALVEQAFEIDPNNASAHFVAGQIAAYKKDLNRWEAEIKAHLSLNPNSAAGYWALGQLSIYLGKPLAAIAPLERAKRLDPALAHGFIHFLGLAHLVAGNYETAAALFRERIELRPETDFSRAFLSSALGHLGRIDEARRTWAEIEGINPRYSFAEHIGRLPFKDAADAARITEGLKKADLPN